MRVWKTLPVFLLAVFLISSTIVSAGDNEVLLTEIMYDPEGNDLGQTDWIELYNPTEEDIIFRASNFGIIDEKDLVIGRDGIHYLSCHAVKEDFAIPAKSFVILADKSSEFRGVYENMDAIDTTFDLSTSGDYIRLSNDKCATFFLEVEYNDKWGGKNNGKTLELIDFLKGYLRDNWQQSFIKRGSPKLERSKPIQYPKGIVINEIFPNPSSGQMQSEFLEIYNGGESRLLVDDWIIADKGNKKCILRGEIEAGGFLVVKDKQYSDCVVALNDGEEVVQLFNPNGDLVSSVSYQKAKDGRSFSFDGSAWHWTAFLTPGEENHFEVIPAGMLYADDQVYKGVYAYFKIKGLSKKAKVVWDFGDGHKSYLQSTKHKFTQYGIFQGSVKFSEGSEDVIKKFEVKVEDYPEAKVKIVGINANPKGKDSDFETITLENKTKKKINLKGWSIATGWKKLINHPILEDFEIKAGKAREITREFSKFSLNNKQLKIELRYPDGDVASHVKYKLEKNIAEGSKYIKTGKEWVWQNTTQNPHDKIQISNKIQNQNSNNNMINIQSLVGNQNVIGENQEMQSKIEVKSKLKEMELLPLEEKVLGAETVKEVDGRYAFTNETRIEEEHYLRSSLREFGMSANAFFSWILRFF